MYLHVVLLLIPKKLHKTLENIAGKTQAQKKTINIKKNEQIEYVRCWLLARNMFLIFF